MNAVTVSQVNTYIKSILDGDKILPNIYVTGEISNYVYYRKSGHIYLTLKDDTSQLKAVMFSAYASRLKFSLQDGMKVICRGRISCYERDGIYQLYIEDVQPDGIGALNLAYEQLKEKLQKEGLFDSLHKKSLPKFPDKIGVATSNVGAAVEDIKNIISRRYPLCELVIIPTVVQGSNAPSDIINSISILDSIDDIDLIIVARGGGSAEDLWAFNDEGVARAVYNSKKPIISAVGHETDFTICDFVADLRAPTPSAAAELAVPDINVLLRQIFNAESSLNLSLNRRLEYDLIRFDKVLNSVLFEPDAYIKNKFVSLNALSSQITQRFTDKLDKRKSELSSITNKIIDLSPLNILKRGFCTVKDDSDNPIKSVNTVSVGENVTLTFCDGTAKCTVNEVNYE
ncbi:MAG: exodeoxyribonuclease VII large subunit [Eubacterium sp.]|nr:exodeoxyribonuclease VII large subunit [Eubacterium sp.]